MSEEIEYPSKERERAKVNVKVSAEVNTYLHDLYNQIQYEVCEQYEDEIKYLQQKVEQLEKENKELNLELSGYRQAILNDDNLMGLKLKIDKAITYIKTGKTFENKNTKKVVDTIQNDLLNILNKGSDKQ